MTNFGAKFQNEMATSNDLVHKDDGRAAVSIPKGARNLIHSEGGDIRLQQCIPLDICQRGVKETIFWW